MADLIDRQRCCHEAAHGVLAADEGCAVIEVSADPVGAFAAGVRCAGWIVPPDGQVPVLTGDEPPEELTQEQHEQILRQVRVWLAGRIAEERFIAEEGLTGHHMPIGGADDNAYIEWALSLITASQHERAGLRNQAADYVRYAVDKSWPDIASVAEHLRHHRSATGEELATILQQLRVAEESQTTEQ